MYYGDLGTNSYMAKNLIECDLGLEMGRPGKNPRKKNAPPHFSGFFSRPSHLYLGLVIVSQQMYHTRWL